MLELRMNNPVRVGQITLQGKQLVGAIKRLEGVGVNKPLQRRHVQCEAQADATPQQRTKIKWPSRCHDKPLLVYWYIVLRLQANSPLPLQLPSAHMVVGNLARIKRSFGTKNNCGAPPSKNPVERS